MSKIRILLLMAAVVIAAAFFGKSYIILTASLVIAVLFFTLAYKFLNADSLEFKKNRARVPTLSSALRGHAHIRDDWIPDARVQGGMIFDRRKRRIVIVGRLSDDSLDRAFK
jgi:hypothetical protein